MLNLSRRIGESVYIGDRIAVTITAVNGTQVRIGVGAPPEVRIVREELLTRPPPDPAPV